MINQSINTLPHFSKFLVRSRTVPRKFSIGGLCSSAGGGTYSVSRFNLGGLELCLRG